MYKVNTADKSLTKLSSTNFASRNLLERYDIQEWIEKNPEILGEDLLIIGKELDLLTGIRLDLLAIDKKARLVIIELKRDDSGKSADWQAIKYASHCSNFKLDDIIENYSSYLNADNDEAKLRIEDFIDENFEKLNLKQRIILVSKEFHPDVLSAIFWLREYEIDIECIKLKPFIDENDELFIYPDKIIPIPEARDYIIKKERKQNAIRMAQGEFFEGNVIETAVVFSKGNNYRIERYDSTSIRIYNLDSQKYEVAKPLLRGNRSQGLKKRFFYIQAKEGF